MGIKFSLFIASDGSAFLMFMPSIGRGWGALYGSMGGAVEAGVGDAGVSEGGIGGGTEGGRSGGGSKV